jgi:hypothetical protein
MPTSIATTPRSDKFFNFTVFKNETSACHREQIAPNRHHVATNVSTSQRLKMGLVLATDGQSHQTET